MDPAIVISLSPAPAQSGVAQRRSGRSGMWVTALRRLPPAHLALCAVLAVSLGLRLWGIKQGLPFSYNSDEATHFVPKAVGFLGGDLNPHYFLNPPAYTYLLYVVLVAWFGGGHGLHAAYVNDPTSVFVLARAVAAVLGTASVWLTYLAGARLFGRWAGVLAAAVLGLAFLPVFYSHLALNDTPTLAPVALALWGCARIVGWGRWAPAAANFGAGVRNTEPESQSSHRAALDYALAGLGLGLAAATKYTGGIVLFCLLGAFASDARRGPARRAVRRLAIGLAVALAAFLAANPYALLNHHAFLTGLSDQAGAVGAAKLGTNPSNGWVYYLWTFTWGLGWVPALAALAGSALLTVRRRWVEALVLLPAIVAYVIFMGAQQRFFGRWLMPIFPIMAILAGYAGAQAVGWLGRDRRPAVAVLVGGTLAALLLAQSGAADVHNDAVLSRPDTRNLARSWMVAHIPGGAKVVIEPIAPNSWGERWHQYPTAVTSLNTAGQPLRGPARPIHIDQYESHLGPALLSRYVAQGYCWVITGSQQSDRAYVRPSAARGALAYYAAVARRDRLVYRVSPYGAGSRPPKFNFDWPFDYYPRQYRLPGPAISIYRLTGGSCGRA